MCAGAGGRVCACAQGRAPSFKVWRRHRAGRRVQSVQSIGAAGAGRGCGYLSYMVWAGGASGRRWRALLCVGMLCKLLYVPGGTYGCTVQQYGSLAFYFATCHELPQAIFELVRGSVSEQTLLTSLAMGCIGLCGLAAMLTTVPRSNPTKKDKAD